MRIRCSIQNHLDRGCMENVGERDGVEILAEMLASSTNAFLTPCDSANGAKLMCVLHLIS